MKRLALLGLVLAFAAGQAGCATIFSGSKSKIRIESDPPGAGVVVIGGGTTVAFVHPKGSFGTLIELVQE